MYFYFDQGTCNSLYTLADGSSGDWLAGILFSSSQEANVAVQDQLSALSFTRSSSSQIYTMSFEFIAATLRSSHRVILYTCLAVWLLFLVLDLSQAFHRVHWVFCHLPLVILVKTLRWSTLIFCFVVVYFAVWFFLGFGLQGHLALEKVKQRYTSYLTEVESTNL